MSNAINAAAVLQNILTMITNLEAGGLVTGDQAVDAETRRLITTPRANFHAAIWDFGSRAQQLGAQTARQQASGGAESSIDNVFLQLDQFVQDLQKQIFILNNPTSVPRRSHTPLR